MHRNLKGDAHCRVDSLYRCLARLVAAVLIYELGPNLQMSCWVSPAEFLFKLSFHRFIAPTKSWPSCGLYLVTWTAQAPQPPSPHASFVPFTFAIVSDLALPRKQLLMHEWMTLQAILWRLHDNETFRSDQFIFKTLCIFLEVSDNEASITAVRAAPRLSHLVWRVLTNVLIQREIAVRCSFGKLSVNVEDRAFDKGHSSQLLDTA